jgi:glycosyltransferase 2 family protein
MNGAARTGLGVLLWVVAVGMVLFLLRTVPLAEVWVVLRRLDGTALLILAAVNGLVLVTLNGRWWLILLGLGYRLPFLRLLGHRLAAFGVSYFTPGPHFGGEPVQVLLVERDHGVPRATAVAAVTLDKTVEMLVNFAFLVGGITAVLHSQLFGDAVGGEALLFALVLLALPGLLLLAIWQEWYPLSRTIVWIRRWPLWGRHSAWLQRLHHGIRASEKEAAQFCHRAPHALWAAFVISVLGWGTMIGEYWLMLRFLGMTLTPLQAITLLTAARIAILLPLPGGLGSLEASQVFALGLMGGSAAAGISISVLIRARDVLLGLLGLWWGARHLPGRLRPLAHPSRANRVINE